jgi:hypothetical protein
MTLIVVEPVFGAPILDLFPPVGERRLVRQDAVSRSLPHER